MQIGFSKLRKKISRYYQRSRWNQSTGLGMIEILLAASISTVGLLGFAIVFQRYQLAQKKVAAVLLATSAELDLVLQIENSLSPSYQVAAIQTALANRTSLSGISFPLNVGLVPIPIVADGPAIFVNAKGEACTGGFTNPACAFTDPNCAFVDPNCSFAAQLKSSIIGAGPGARHSFSYQFNVNPQWAVVAPLGNPGAFINYVPSNMYENVALQQCDTGAPPLNVGTEIAIRGINRTTGQVYCIKKPAGACGSNEFPVGIKFTDDFTAGGNTGGRLEMECQSAPSEPTVSCPGSEYVLNAFTADMNGSSGQCVYRTANPQAWPKIYRSERKVTVGRACPKNYEVDPDCSILVTEDPPETTTCGPYTTRWTESCEQVPDPSECEIWSGPQPDTCDLATPPNCTPTPPFCISEKPPTFTYVHHTTAHNESGTRDFPTTDKPTLKRVINADRNSFTCEIVYPDLPSTYQTYDDGRDYLGAASLTTKSCTKKPKWKPAQLRVSFSCVLPLSIPNTVPAEH